MSTIGTSLSGFGHESTLLSHGAPKTSTLDHYGMPALTEFLKGTVKDTLTSLVQPPGLVPAAAFILLNLGVIGPRAKDEKLGLAEAYYGLDDAWQAVIVASLILVVGYVLLSASSMVLDTLSGRTWRTSLLATTLSRCAGTAARTWASASGARTASAPGAGHRARRHPALAPAHAVRSRREPARGDGPRRRSARLGARGQTALRRHRRRALGTAAGGGRARRPGHQGGGRGKVTLDLMANLTFVAALFATEGT